MKDVAPRTILVTGCSSGIGKCAALGLSRRGWRVFATVLDPADQGCLAAKGLDTLHLDYTDSESIEAAIGHVLAATGGRLDAVFHNGGFAQVGAFEDLPTELFRAQLEASVFGWHDLTRRVIPVMRRQGHGRIIFCSSVLGFVAAPFRGAYVASKHAIEGYADTLRLELADTGIHVILIQPGPIESRFRENSIEAALRTIDIDASVHSGEYRRQLADSSFIPRFRRPPEAVLAKLVAALESPRPKPRYRVTELAHFSAAMKRLLSTRMLDRLIFAIASPRSR